VAETYPSPEEVACVASETILALMTRGGTASSGSDKSGPGDWFWRDNFRYNTDRIISHLSAATQMIDGNKNMDAEGPEGHLARALCRAAFVFIKFKKGKIK
jgi:hypothetical protein